MKNYILTHPWAFRVYVFLACFWTPWALVVAILFEERHQFTKLAHALVDAFIKGEPI